MIIHTHCPVRSKLDDFTAPAVWNSIDRWLPVEVTSTMVPSWEEEPNKEERKSLLKA